MSDQNQLLEAALQYAGRGWRVLPLHNPIFSLDGTNRDGSAARPIVHCSCGKDCGKDRGKHPRIRGNAFKAGSTDSRQIEAWWAQWPQANIGLACGGGLAVLDLDGPEEAQKFAELVAEHGGLPDTMTVRTGRGLHLYFTGDEPGSRKIAGLLLRGRGGYVVAPPSVHATGAIYQVVVNVPLIPLPNWFRELEQVSDKPTVIENWAEHLGPKPAFLAGSSTYTAINDKAFQSQHNPAEEMRLRMALSAIPANCDRDTWLRIGMALHSTGWDEAFQIWLDWSKTGGEKFQGEQDLITRWISFGKPRARRVTIGTLIELARDHGWRPEAGASGARHTNATGTASPVPDSPPGGTNGAHSLAAVAPQVFQGGPFGGGGAGAPGGGTTQASPGGGAGSPAAGGAPGGGPIIFPDLDRLGRPRATCRNTRTAINLLGINCCNDAFHGRMTIGGQAIGQWAGELTDDSVHMLRIVISQVYGFDPGTEACHDAAIQECLQHSFDPVLDYLDRVQWDGVPRLATWTTRYLGAEDTAIHRATAGLTLVAAVRRARQPGVKFDHILTLIGEEGRRKSSAIELMAGRENFSDQSILTMDDRGQMEAVQGVWIYELADLVGLSRVESERTKAFASRAIDRARPAYGRRKIERKRRCIFVATTNHETFLKSQTGNRRFWPVAVGRVDIEGLARDRDQIWAEAAAVERTGLSLELPERLWKEAALLQDARREDDPWEEILTAIKGRDKSAEGKPFLTGDGKFMELRVSTRDIYEIYLRLSTDKMTDIVSKRVGMIMRRLGWEGPKLIREGNEVIRGYTKRGGEFS